MHTIYGVIESNRIVFVGCTKGNAPDGALILEDVESHPEVHWTKWCLRFRRTLKNSQAPSRDYAGYFTNSSRLKRLLGDEELKRLSANDNAEFLDFHARNPEVLEKLLSAARAEKADGRARYSVGQQVGDVRWDGTKTDADDRFKINSRWGSWYSRALQMADPTLAGFFNIKSCAADGLVWTDGRSWAEFAAANEDKLNWVDPWAEFPDEDWEFTE